MTTIIIATLEGQTVFSLNVTEHKDGYLVQSDTQAYSEYNAVVSGLAEVERIALTIRQDELSVPGNETNVLSQEEIKQQVTNARH